MVSHHVRQASPHKIIVNGKYVQWLAFHSILLSVAPCAKIHPKDAHDLEVLKEQSSWTSILMHLSFPSRSGPSEIFSDTGQRWVSSSLTTHPCCWVCMLPVSISLFSRETFPLPACSVQLLMKGSLLWSAYKNFICLLTGEWQQAGKKKVPMWMEYWHVARDCKVDIARLFWCLIVQDTWLSL